MKIEPWFEPGFDESIEATIKQHWSQNATLACQNESHRWAKLLLELNPDCDVEINDGMFQVEGDPCNSEGHTWLVVEGCIFDPTAAQFDGDIDSTYYEVHECVDGDNLRKRLADYGSAVRQVKPAGMLP